MISLIVAMDKNRAIGKKGALPWKLSADLKKFKEVTSGHSIIMGRKTYDSIGRALPKRTNIVITRSPGLLGGSTSKLGDVHQVSNLMEAIGMASFNEGGEEIFIIGGGEIFKEAIEMADRLYVTEVDTAVKDADVFFPEIYDNIWKEISRVHYQRDAKNEFDYNFVMYERR